MSSLENLHPGRLPDIIRMRFVRRFLKEGAHSTRPIQLDGWQVRRFCQEDWLLNVRVYRIIPRRRFEIALFLVEDHEKFVKDSGTMAGLTFSLSDAYEKLGKMEIYFVGPPEGHEPEVPTSIRRVAQSLGVNLSQQSMITDSEGRELCAELTGFSPVARNTFKQLKIDLTRACFIVQRGIWSRDQVELIGQEASAPEQILDGSLTPEFRLAYQHDLLVLRLALMGERVKTFLEHFSEAQDAVISTERISPTEVEYFATKDLVIPTLGDVKVCIKAGQRFRALLAPRTAQDYEMNADADRTAAKARTGVTLLAVTKDFSVRLTKDIAVLPIVDTLTELDLEIEKRLARSASTRRALPEKPD